MYTHKKHILLLAALLKAHGIGQVVLCPGSRNIAIIKTLSKIDGIQCHAVTDERSAAFYALGLALQTRKPAAVLLYLRYCTFKLPPCRSRSLLSKRSATHTICRQACPMDRPNGRTDAAAARCI